MIARLRRARARLETWRDRSINRRIFAAIFTVSAMTLAVKAVTTAKDLFVATRFGTGDDIDAFLLAFSVPLFAVNVLLGPVGAALVPGYIHSAERDRDEARRLHESALAYLLALVGLVVMALALGADLLLPHVARGFSPQKLALTRRLFFVLLPVLAIEALSTSWGAVLNARERFAVAALAPMGTALGPLAGIALAPRYGIYSLAAGTVLGFAGEALLVGQGLRRHGMSVWPRFHRRTPRLDGVIRQYGAFALGGVFMGAQPMIDQFMASSLAPGSVSALSYGQKVSALVLGIGTMALGSAVLPFFSQLVARSDWTSVRKALRTYGGLTLLLAVPFTLLVVTLSEPIVRLLFQRGAFRPEDVPVVARVQAMYALQVPFYLLGSLAARLIFSLQGNHLMIALYAITVVVHVALNALFMRSLGAAGIALSVACTYALNLALYALAIRALWRHRTHAPSAPQPVSDQTGVAVGD